MKREPIGRVLKVEASFLSNCLKVSIQTAFISAWPTDKLHFELKHWPISFRENYRLRNVLGEKCPAYWKLDILARLDASRMSIRADGIVYLLTHPLSLSLERLILLNNQAQYYSSLQREVFEEQWEEWLT